ncbi:hypothetical protein F5Y16DRAFT_364683 [Xylariaceae sp. FL0255]|nr:hypothetical protein F5Y16DRAFT_364683 [Xylariaceae sp. FL0255]
MPTPMQPKTQIEWIDLSNAPGGTSETRHRVRSHVVKKTADARRKNPAWGKRNQRQLPHYVTELRFDQDINSDTVESESSVINATRIAQPMPLTGVELLAAETGVHVVDLSALTDIQCVYTACATLASKSILLSDLVGRRRQSYLHFVASRYGSSLCLDEALRCVATRAKRFLGPCPQLLDEIESRQYMKALKALQEAVDDEEERKQPEVLASINLLSLFELLGCTPSQTWFLHIGGASRLIRTRGPASFVSDFDIRLVLSMLMAITHESLRAGEPCFMEEKSWQDMLYSFATDSDPISSRGKLSIILFSLVVRLPRLLMDVTVACNQTPGIAPPDLPDLRLRLTAFRRELLNWRVEYNMATLSLPVSTDGEDIRAELLGSFYGLSISCTRMLCAISIDSLNVLEDEAIVHAKEMVKLECDFENAHQPAVSFYLGQKLLVAKATLATTNCWRAESTRSTDVIPYSKYRCWLSWMRL